MSDSTDPIDNLLDVTLAKLQGFDRLDRRWFAEALLDDLGCVYGIGDAGEPLRAIRDVGEGFVTTVALAAQRQPERTGDVYRAAHGVLVGLLEVVQEALHDSDAGGAGGYSSASSPGT